jgi:hypothetical protein
MKTDEEKAKLRQAYLDGTQARDVHGDRLWWIVSWNYWEPTDEYKFRMWECDTAEGPYITAVRDMITGKCKTQVSDGSPERSDACAERFVFDMEWTGFVLNWDLFRE